MTYGQLRLRLSKLAPSLDLELIDGWIGDRYTEILDTLPWKRAEAEITLQSPASHQESIAAVAQGSIVMSGSGTRWTNDLVGSLVRVANGPEFYIVAQVMNPTEIILDRPYEGASALSGTSYRVDRNTFAMPSEARIIRAVRPLHSGVPITLTTPGDLNRRFPRRTEYGMPRYAAPTWDTQSDPPMLQVELYPIPDSPAPTGETLAFAVDYIYDPTPPDPTQTSASVMPWVRTSALLAGVRAEIARHQGNLAGAQDYEARFTKLVDQMAMINALQRGPQALRRAPELRGHNPSVPGYHHGRHSNLDYFDEDGDL